MTRVRLTATLGTVFGLQHWRARAPPRRIRSRTSTRGKSVSLMVGGSAGGGYDILSRALAKYLGNHILAIPSIIVKNMPGAGNILMTNFMYNASHRRTAP